MFNIFSIHIVFVLIFIISKKVLTHYKKRLKKLLLLAILKGNKKFYLYAIIVGIFELVLYLHSYPCQ